MPGDVSPLALARLPQTPDPRYGGNGIAGLMSGFVSGMNTVQGWHDKRKEMAERDDFESVMGSRPPGPEPTDAEMGRGFANRLGGFAGAYLGAQAERERAADPLFSLKETLMRQNAQMGDLQVKEAVKNREDVIRNESLLGEFSALVDVTLKSETAADLESVIQIQRFLGQNPSLLADPRTKGILTMFEAGRKIQEAALAQKRGLEASAAARQQGLEETLEVGEDGKVVRTFKAKRPDLPLSGIGKEISDFNEAVASGNTEAASMLRAAIMARGQKDGMSFEFGPDGRISRIAQGANAGAAKLPTSTVAEAEQTANSAANIVNFGNEIVRLAKPGNVGIPGNVKRIAKELAGQFMPVEAGEEFDFAQSVTFFKGAATKILRSDSQITEDERRSIIADLPSKGFLESDATARKKAEDAVRKVAQSARRQVMRAGVKLPAEIMTRDELAAEVAEGRLTAEQAATIWSSSPFNR